MQSPPCSDAVKIGGGGGGGGGGDMICLFAHYPKFTQPDLDLDLDAHYKYN